MPPFTGLASIALVVGTFVAFAGLEVNAVHIKHLVGRPKSYFKAVMTAAATVLFMYMLGSIAISVAVPDSSLELTSGASQAFSVYADGFGIPGLSNILSGLLVLGAVAASIAWIAGPSRSMWLVGRAGYLPKVFQRTNKNDVQMPILFFQGVIVTILALVFVVAPNTSSAFALLQDISIILYMRMYVCMFAAAIRLRRSQPDVARPIRIPGLQVISCVGILAALSAIVLGLTPPSGYTRPRGRCTPLSWWSEWSSWRSLPRSCTTSAAPNGPASTRPRSSPSRRSSRVTPPHHQFSREGTSRPWI